MKDWRGGRAASFNIIPSSTGAAKVDFPGFSTTLDILYIHSVIVCDKYFPDLKNFGMDSCNILIIS